ncbi:MAG: hypothetical protein ABIO92_10900 [Chloroflexia bacterium]
MGYDQTTRELAVRLYLEGNSFRGIGKVLNVHYVSVINWVNAHERSLSQEVSVKTPTDTVDGGDRRAIHVHNPKKERVSVVV